MVILRDGRKLIGVFRSYDQFGMSPSNEGGESWAEEIGDIANFLMDSTVERLHWRLDFADRDLGELILSLELPGTVLEEGCLRRGSRGWCWMRLVGSIC
jgi:hypothetical protein